MVHITVYIMCVAGTILLLQVVIEVEACQDLNSHLEEREQQFGQRVQMARASEAEVLAEAWRMSGELRSELDAVRSGEAAPASQDSSARQALQDLRELRQRYNDMLG